MDEETARYNAVMGEIDRYLSENPRELKHAERVFGLILEQNPDASEALRIAAKAHDINKRDVKREDFPEGYDGFRQWRAAMEVYSADFIRIILEKNGYDIVFRKRVI